MDLYTTPTPDIQAMNAVATNLRQRAGTLTTVSARLDAQVAAMVYAGPAADQFRANAADRRQRLARAVAELEGLSAVVTRAALSAEADAQTAVGYTTTW